MDKAVYKTNDFFAFGVFGISATPVVADGKCFVQGLAGLYCLSVRDGTLLWQVNTAPTHSSPLVANGIVYWYDSAYNAETGKQLWTNPELTGCIPRLADASIWKTGGTNYVIAAGSKGLCCLNMETGKMLWTPEGIRACYFNLHAICGDIMTIISNPFRAYKLSLGGATLLWEKQISKPGIDWGTDIIWRDHVCLLSDAGETGPTTLRCLDLKTGDEKWTSPVYSDSEGGSSQPIAADGKLFFTIGSPHQAANQYGGRPPSTLTFEMEMVSANPEGKYTRLGKFHPEICPMASPALVDGRLYVRAEKCVACYDLRAK